MLFLLWLVHLIVFLEPSFLVTVNFLYDQQMLLNVRNVTGVRLTFKGRMLHICRAACIPWWTNVTCL